jgi:hypothetical protein
MPTEPENAARPATNTRLRPIRSARLEYA